MLLIEQDHFDFGDPLMEIDLLDDPFLAEQGAFDDLHLLAFEDLDLRDIDRMILFPGISRIS